MRPTSARARKPSLDYAACSLQLAFSASKVKCPLTLAVIDLAPQTIRFFERKHHLEKIRASASLRRPASCPSGTCTRQTSAKCEHRSAGKLYQFCSRTNTQVNGREQKKKLPEWTARPVPIYGFAIIWSVDQMKSDYFSRNPAVSGLEKAHTCAARTK